MLSVCALTLNFSLLSSLHFVIDKVTRPISPRIVLHSVLSTITNTYINMLNAVSSL